MGTCKMIQAQNLEQIDPDNSVILDVRTDMEHGEVRLRAPHEHVVLDDLDPDDFMQRRGFDKDINVYILCRSGGRAQKAAEKFTGQGYANIYVIEGGLQKCREAGLLIEGHAAAQSLGGKGGPIPLERQVRIVAGLFVAGGCLLTLFVHTGFIVIPLFVGLGLVYAGMTDNCTMALVLTKAPWNKTLRDKTCAIPAQKPPVESKGQSCQ